MRISAHEHPVADRQLAAGFAQAALQTGQHAGGVLAVAVVQGDGFAVDRREALEAQFV